MKRILYIFLLPLLGAISCTRTNVIDPTYPWPTSGVAEADSLMVAFERARTDNNIGLDTRSQIMSKICSIASEHPDNQLLAMRRVYVETCEKYTSDPAGAARQLEVEMRNFDSITSPYDWHSLQALQLPSEKNIYRKYMLASANVEFFDKAGAEMELGRNLILKGNALCELSDTAGALDCFTRAQDILTKQGAQEALYATKLNTLPLLPPRDQRELLDNLLQDTVAKKLPKIYVPICQTAYYVTESVEYLDRAIAMASDYTPNRNLLPILLSMKGSNMADNGQTRAALSLVDSIRSFENAYQPSTRYRVAIHYNLANIYDAAGEKDSCIAQLVEHDFWEDSLQREVNYRQVYANESRLHIEAVQNYARLKHRTVIVWWVVSLLVVILLSVFIFRRKAEKRREEIRILDERIEHQRRLTLAQESILKNVDEMVAQTESIVKGLSIQSITAAEAIARLRRVIADYHRKEEDQKGFLTVSREIDNSFSQRLKKDFPDISESQLRLASMIAAGMDSHQLSSALNISSKSLYTSRYRLRTRLNLPKDASLEDFLRQYAN